MPETLPRSVSQPTGFLCLPLEIRDKIYFHLLLRGAILVQYLNFEVDPCIRSMWEDPERLYDDMGDPIPERKTGILSVSRQISVEALNVLYGHNIFTVHVHVGAHNKLLKFGTANIQRIRYLRLVAQPFFCFPEPVKFNSQLWLPLLTGLSKLYLVVQQPLEARGCYKTPALEEDIQKWIAWLEPILRFLAQNITEETIVGVDDNGLMETGDVIQKYFRSGYENIQTVTGDKIFKRGMFSWESGYWGVDDSEPSVMIRKFRYKAAVEQCYE